MKQQDYKEIANILKNFEHDWEAICIELADYFEKEDEKNQPTKNVWNRNQFLKDCGVD